MSQYSVLFGNFIVAYRIFYFKTKCLDFVKNKKPPKGSRYKLITLSAILSKSSVCDTIMIVLPTECI